MESTINIEVNVVTNMFRVVDSTDYAAQGVSLAALAAKGLGTVRFNGDIVYQKLLVGDPLVNLAAGATTSAWVACPLDSNGNAAYGTYTCDYSVRTTLVNEDVFSVTAGSGGTGGFTLENLDMREVFVVGDTFTISSSLAGNNGVKTITSISFASGDTTLFVSGNVNAEVVVSSNFSYDLTRETDTASAVYAGCTQIVPSFTFVSDCDYGTFGRLSVVDTTDVDGQTIVSRLLTLMYPSWKDTANVTSDEGAIILNTLSTGTWTVSNVYELSQTTGDLIVTYTATLEEERRVTCSGSLCGLLPCVENLLQAHSASVKTGFSPYQYYVDAITLNYIQALEYKKCGNYDEYQARVAAIDALLDASGCDCSCCDNDVLIDVVNIASSDANAITILQEQMVIVQNSIVEIEELINNQSTTISELNDAIVQFNIDLGNLQALYTTLSATVADVSSQFDTYFPAMQAQIADLENAIYDTGGIMDQLVTLGVVTGNHTVQLSSLSGTVGTLVTDVDGLVNNSVFSVTGLNTDNTDPQNPVVGISTSTAAIVGAGTFVDPLRLKVLVKAGSLTQTATNAPFYTSAYQTQSDSMVFTRIAAGSYRATITPAFDMAKVFPFLSVNDSTKGVRISVESSTQIRIFTFDATTFALEDDILLNSKLLINFY